LRTGLLLLRLRLLTLSCAHCQAGMQRMSEEFKKAGQELYV
jgi:hypothetical protein